MPLVRVTCHKGVLTQAQKDLMAEGFSHAVLVGEIGEDTEFGRPFANVLFNEIDPESDWYVAGSREAEPPKGGRFMIDTYFPQGSTPQTGKTEFHRAIQNVIDAVMGVDGTFPNRVGDWVMIHEIASGNWGFSGRTAASADIAVVVKAKPERVAFTEAVLAGWRKLRVLGGFPAGAAPD